MTQNISGELHVSNDVLSDMVSNAVAQCYGVVGMAAPTQTEGLARLLSPSRSRKGVSLQSTEEGLLVDLYVIIEYGTNISTVSKNLVEQVTFALTHYAQVPLAGVEVHVQGVRVRRS